MSLAYRMIDSPVGKLKLVAGEKGSVAVLWENDKPSRVRLEALVEDRGHATLVEAERQLGEYVAGRREVFSVPLDMKGTSFQKNVWEALLAIPFGETRSYGQLAAQLGQRKGDEGGRCCEWKKPDLHHRALPSRDWVLWKTDRFRGRT